MSMEELNRLYKPEDTPVFESDCALPEILNGAEWRAARSEELAEGAQRSFQTGGDLGLEATQDAFYGEGDQHA